MESLRTAKRTAKRTVGAILRSEVLLSEPDFKSSEPLGREVTDLRRAALQCPSSQLHPLLRFSALSVLATALLLVVLTAHRTPRKSSNYRGANAGLLPQPSQTNLF